MHSKTEARLDLKAQAKAFRSVDFSDEDASSIKALLASPLYMNASTVFAFIPLKSEVDITPLLDQASKTKTLALPRCNEDMYLTFHLVTKNWREETKKNMFAIKEPLDGKLVTPDDTSLLLIPAMAYTASGERLGRGKGYYDRYLQAYKTGTTLGICRSYQLVETLPTETWDQKVEYVVCAGIFYCC